MTRVNMPLGVTGVMLPDLDFDEQLSLCAELGLTHYSIRPRVIPDSQRGKPYGNWGNHKFDLTPARLAKEAKDILRKIKDAGLTPFGTVPNCNTDSPDDAIKLDLEGAAAAEAGRVRVAPAPYPKEVFDYASALSRLIERYKQIVELAKPYGLKIVIETHCLSMGASPVLAWNICRHFDPKDMGVIFDLPNFAREGEQERYLAVSVIGKYIDHCHIGACRRIEGKRDEDGFRVPEHQMCGMTESDLYIPGYLQALSEAGIITPLIIEDFTPNKPGKDRLVDSCHALRKICPA